MLLMQSDKQKYNKLTNYLKKVSLVNFLFNLSPKDGGLWRETRNISKSANLPVKNQNSSYVITDPDKA